MAVNLSPIWGAGAQLFDNSGNVLSGGKIYTYAAGTTTPATTYTSSSGITANSNPIILNSAGRVPYEIWLTDGQNYKFVLKDSNDVLIGTWDNLSGINSNFVNYVNQQEIQTATAGQTVFNLTTMNYLVGTNSLSVFVDGVNQYGPGAQYAYEETDSSTVTFASGLHVGAEVKFTSTQIQNAGAVDASQVSYTAPFSGSVTETVEDKLSEVISAADFGDIDGIGTVTLNVPADYGTIQDALDFLANKRIVAGTTVKIQVADGTYTLVSGIDANHPDGHLINIVGNTTTPDNCVITVSGVPTFDAITVSDGNILGLLDGFKFTLATKATSAENYTAILANDGGQIICGPKIKTNNWYYGIAARNGSFISCDYAVVDNAGDVGIWAYVGSTIYCRNATSTNASDVANSLGFGFQAEYGSAMDCSNASASGCNVGGIASLSNSTVRAWNCTSSTNTGSGFYASAQGHIENHSSTANNNTRYGEERNLNGTIVGGGVTLTGNTIAAYNPYVYIDNTIGARIAASGGDMRLDTNGAYNVYFNTSGGLQFGVIHQASAVNSLYAQGGTAGNPAILGAEGSDSVVDLYLVPKGVGSHVRLAAGYTAVLDTPVIGQIEIKDNTGTVRKLAVIA